MRKSWLIRILSVIVCLSLLITYDLPVTGAEGTAPISSAIQNAHASISAHIVAEDASKRTQDSKEFLRSDGSRMIALYGEPVHYLASGGWQDIDNTLVASRSKSGDDVLVNRANSFVVELPVDFSQKTPITIRKNNYTLGFVLEGEYPTVRNKTLSTDSGLTKGLSEEQTKILPKNLQSSVTYSNVLANTDFAYDVSSDRLKESIVLRSIPDKGATYTFDIDVVDLEPVLQKDNSIYFYPKGKTDVEPVFVIPAPFMTDADGETSYDVKVALDLNSGCRLTYAPSNEWLSDVKRAWPVAIDPVVIANLDRSNIRDQQVDSLNNNVNYNSAYLECGRNATYGIERFYMKYRTLPAITSADYIVDASIQIYRGSSNTVQAQIEVHKVNATWESETLQWSNKPGYDTNIDDYQTVYYDGWYTWRITDIARGWYSGDNTGMMFKQTDAIENTNNPYYYKQFYSSDYGADYRPILTITYRSNTGVEDYWSFHDYALSHSGSLAVNDYNGNPVFSQALANTPGSLAPATLGLVFNGSYRNNIDTTLGWGKGWRSVYDQRVDLLTFGSTQYYSFIDGDGTTHYFYSNNGTWYNEEGLDLTLLPSESLDNGTHSYLTITDKSGNKLCFYLLSDATLPGRLKEIRDATGQANRSIKLEYAAYGTPASYCLSIIKDGTDHQITISRATSGLIDSVADPAGRVTDLALDGNGYLTNVLFPDGYDTDFGYDSNGNLSTATDCDNRRFTITYDCNPSFSGYNYRVHQVQESETATSTVGQKSIFTYGQNSTTIEDESGLRTIYQFNTYGNCINVIGPDGSAGFASYGQGVPGQDGATVSNRNKPTQTSKTQKFVPNKLKNHNFEGTTDWATTISPSGDGSVSFATDSSVSGTHSLKIVKNSTSYYNFSQQSVNLALGKTYTFSAYMKTSGVSSAGSGAYLEAKYLDNSGTYIYFTSPAIKGTTDWTRQSVTFTLPAGLTSNAVKFTVIIKYSSGTAWFDCAQVEEGTVVNRYNLVENPDFDYITSTLPNFWTRGSYSNSNDIAITTADSTNPPLSSDNCYQMEGISTQSKTLNQTVALAGSTGDTFVLGAWAKGYAIPLVTQENQSPTRDFSVQIGFVNGGTTTWTAVSFNSCLTSWQYASSEITALTAYTSIQIRVVYGAGVNKVCFDGVQLYKELFGSGYSYDANGNLTSTASVTGTSSTATYSSNDLTAVTLPGGGSIGYTYDAAHRPLTATSATGVRFEMVYDPTTGQQKEAKEGSLSTYARSTSEYSDSTGYDSRYLTAVTDPFGKQILYDYDTQRGLNTSVTQPNGLTVNQTYQNSTGLLTGSSAEISQNVFITNGLTYINNSRIANIRHSTGSSSTFDVIYGYAYNALGWLTGVTVGGNTLVTNSFQAQSGRLNSTTYGNGQTLNYIYDSFNRIVGLNLGSTPKYAFDYDATGQLGYVKDLVQNKEYRYLSDLAGRLSEVRRSDGSSTRYTYNSMNSITALNETIGSTNYSTTYGYDSDQRATTTTNGSMTTTINYDTAASMDRVVSVVRQLSGIEKLATSYAYLDGATNKSVTSKRLGTMTNSGKDPIFYTYDDNGNIATITQGSNLQEFFYDGLNQLIRENISVAGAASFTRTYTYDLGGNILTRNVYTYVQGNQALGTLQSNDVYSYSDSSWKDKLTSFNSQAITYDAIGNPMTWYGPTNTQWTASWTMGRQLASASDMNSSATYKYGADGIRTEKTVNGVTTVYNVVGGVVTWEKTGTNPAIHYTYDANSDLVSLEYNGSSWFYVRNAQNDVIGLVDASSGTWAAQYVYDSWGKPLAVLDGNGNSVLGNPAHIANINPYRYRGYRFDSETGLYYLNSRYYNPAWGRMLNADDLDTLGVNQSSPIQNNLFVYALNNPIRNSDPSGYFTISNNLKIGITVGILAIAAGLLIASGAGAPIGCVLIGMAQGAIVGAVTGAATGAVIGGATAAVSHRVSTGSWKGAGSAALTSAKQGMIDGAFEGAITGAITGGMTSNACFVAGTAVLTASGYVAIETIKAGDLIYSEDPETGEKGLKKVVQTFIHETSELVRVTVNGKEITTTPEHPFYVPQKGWTGAIHLRAGDILVRSNGEYVVVEEVQHEILESPIEVYNFEVDSYHTYFVSDISILVHNACTSPGNYRINFDDGSSYIGKGSSSRMNVSANNILGQNPGLKVANRVWKPSLDNKMAFVDEYFAMKEAGFPYNNQLRNIIQSPGKRIAELMKLG